MSHLCLREYIILDQINSTICGAATSYLGGGRRSMADPLDIVERIIGFALKIKEAAETAEENEEECRGIEQRADRVRAVVTRLSESEEVMKDPMLPGALEDLGETLRRAHSAVVACRRRRTAVCRLCTAAALAKRLHKVHEDITRKTVQAVFVITAAVFIPERSDPSPSSKHPPKPPLHPAADVIEEASYSSSAGFFAEDRYSFPSSFAAGSYPSYRPHRPARRPHRPAAQSRTEDGAATSGSMPRYETEAESKKVPAGTEMPSLLFPGLTIFSMSKLEAATDGFSVGNIIGRGSSDCVVFKGILHEELMVSIKKFQDPPKSLVARISGELHLSSYLHHGKVKNNHIIRILGYCHDVIQKHELVETRFFLVEEYTANGNTANIIYGSQYDWTSRFRIIQGIADGVNYLHEQDVLHLDLKPSNVLLDSDMNPKITGLERARKLNKTMTHEYSIAGTIGYMPPEYILEGTLSTKYDVYSFGVTLLETISGMCGPEPAHHQDSVEWAWEAREAGRMAELIDQSLCGEGELVQVGRCMEIGLLCAQEKSADRPAMADVLQMLNGEKATTTPTRPEYTKKRRSRSTRRDGAFNHCFRASNM
ncbi:unnamed protein product [Urochloa decumbens]|uniref:Protein kinase domain-containing protein n=1 Tax=Urochloa decumbens TaxID=240449 RepID=A0ABC9AIC7_9POAL